MVTDAKVQSRLERPSRAERATGIADPVIRGAILGMRRDIARLLVAVQAGPKKMLTPPEVSEIYRVSVKRVRALCKARRLRSRWVKPKHGDDGYLIPAEAAEEYFGTAHGPET